MVCGQIAWVSYLMDFTCCLIALHLSLDFVLHSWPDGKPPEHFLMGRLIANQYRK